MLREEHRRTINLLVCLLVAGVAGCQPTSPGSSGSATSPSSRPISLITPIAFFSPEQKRLSQHLGWQTGCFQINYTGPEKWFRTRIEVWQKGKPDGNTSSSSLLTGDQELSISVREEPGVKSTVFRVTQVLTSTGGHGTSGVTRTRPELGTWSTSVANIPGPVELIQGQEVAVWAMMHFKSIPGKERTYPSLSTPVAEQAKEADWAIVLTIVLAPPEKK